MKVCVECRHCSEEMTYMRQLHGEHQRFGCRHPEAVSRNVVTGHCFCDEERTVKKGCGRDGRLWEPKK